MDLVVTRYMSRNNDIMTNGLLLDTLWMILLVVDSLGSGVLNVVVT